MISEPLNPDFQYFSSTNPYHERIGEFPEIALRNHDGEKFRGNWLESCFEKNVNEILVEVGPGTGEFLMNHARKNPDTGCIGIEWKYKQVYKIARKVHRTGLKNIRLVRGHGHRIPYLFGPAEVNKFFLLFPDPWPKKKFWSRRLIQGEFMEKLESVMIPGGDFHFRTDHEGYFEWAREVIQKRISRWQILDESQDIYAQSHFGEAPTSEIFQTLFEGLWRKDGQKIHGMILKNSPPPLHSP